MLSFIKTGSKILNVVPLSSSLSTVICPPCSKIIWYTIDKPRPVPLGFVVKKGLYIVFSVSLSIPIPVSEMVISLYISLKSLGMRWRLSISGCVSSGNLARIVSVPPSFIASIALIIKLKNTCSIW